MTPLKAKIANLVAQYAELLALSDWDIDINVCAGDYKASCEAEPEYHKAVLCFHPERFALDDDEDIHRHVIHELLHCHFQGLAGLAEELAGKDEFKREMVRYFHEELTTQFELILWGLLREEMLDD